MDISDLGDQIIALNQLSASLLVTLVAIIAEAIISRIPGIGTWRWHNLVLAPARALERKLNRQKRSDKARLVRGLIAALVLILPALILGTIITGIIIQLPASLAGAVVAMLLTLALRIGLASHIATALRQAIRSGKRDQSNRLIRNHGRGDPAALDDHGLVRAAIEIQCRGWDRGLIAPIFWFLLFGLPGLFVVIAVQAADDIVGQSDKKAEAFGMVITRLDTILHLLPSRIAGGFLLAGLLILRPGKLGAAFSAVGHAAKVDFAINGRWVWGPVAGALDLALAGPIKGDKQRPWIGTGNAKLEPEAIGRARIPLMMSGIILLITMAAGFIGALSAGI